MPPRTPNFFLVGANKAGTTAFHNYLAQHPDVFMSRIKEPSYFVQAFPANRDRARGRRVGLTHSTSTLEDYLRLFDDAGQEKVVGESSTPYLLWPEVAGRIREFNPDARIAAILRNPLERAQSQWVMFVRKGAEPLSFDEAVDLELSGRDGPDGQPRYYLRNGRYREQLQAYLDTFPPERLLIMLYDDFVADPAALLRRAFAFLDVDPDVEIDASARHNASSMPTSPGLQRFVLRHKGAVDVVRNRLPQPLRRATKARLFSAPPTLEEVSDATRDRMREHFRDDVAGVSALVGRDLAHWLA